MYELFIGIINVFFWSLQPLFEKQVVKKTNEPLSIMCLRYIIGGIITFILFTGFIPKSFNDYDYKIYGIMILIVLLGLAAKYCNYLLLNKYKAAIISAIINPLIIIITLILAIIFFNEKIETQQIIGIIIISFGMFVLLYNTKIIDE